MNIAHTFISVRTENNEERMNFAVVMEPRVSLVAYRLLAYYITSTVDSTTSEMTNTNSTPPEISVQSTTTQNYS